MSWSVDRLSTYILRYHIPLDSTFDEHTFKRRGDALIDYCVRNQIPAVMLYVDLNPNWYHMPDTIEHTQQYVEQLRPVIKKLRENSISYQLNYQNLIGAWDGGSDLDDVNSWENWVDQEGIESKGVACCIGRKYREIAGKKLSVWAETKPDVIWIDDDIRFHNHLTSMRDYWSGRIPSFRMDYGCFCDEHIKLFNEKFCTSYSRENIVEGILAGTDIRKQWMLFSGEVAAEFASWIEKTIHDISPNTRVAVMTSAPDHHSVEGRNWKSFLSALSGKDKPLLRPCFGPYQESDPKVFFSSYLLLEHLKANIKDQYGDAVDFCPEIENTRFTRWAKSLAATKYQLFLGAFSGCPGITLSIFDLEGCVLEEEPEWGEMLREMNPVLNTLAHFSFWNWTSEGIGIITSPDRISDSKRSVSNMSSLAEGRNWEYVLTKAGIPCKYVTPNDLKMCSAVALDAFTADLLTDQELLMVLSKGVLLDARAAAYLEARGFGQYVGVNVGNKMPCISSSEVLDQYSHKDGSKIRVTSRIDGYRWSDLKLNGAEQISTLITPHGSEHVGFSRFVNSLGGKVYVYAANGSFGEGFYTNFRVKLLKEICADITQKSIVEVDNRSYALVAAKKKDRQHAIMITNMTADVLDNLKISIPENVLEATIIRQNGEQINAVVQEDGVACQNIGLHIYESVVVIVKVEK